MDKKKISLLDTGGGGEKSAEIIAEIRKNFTGEIEMEKYGG